MEITLYKRNKVSFKFVQYGLALPFFRLEVPNISFCYGNPLTCIKKALDKLEKHEIENLNETGFWMNEKELLNLKNSVRETIKSFLAAEAPLLRDFNNEEEEVIYHCENAIKMDRERLHKKARELWQ